MKLTKEERKEFEALGKGAAWTIYFYENRKRVEKRLEEIKNEWRKVGVV